ncbi:MAG: TonB-dependent receptor domain-containing protein, partial [Burkholderiales bacterium]
AYQDGEITRSLSATAQAGARLAQLPRHSYSLWNKFTPSARWGAALGIIHRGDIFASTDNRVTVPSFTRVDGALYFSLSRQLRAQVNLENLFDEDYFASAHNNNNITPGSPRAVRLSLTTRF